MNKIISINIDKSNKNLIKTLEYIEKEQIDIAMLQDIPNATLNNTIITMTKQKTKNHKAIIDKRISKNTHAIIINEQTTINITEPIEEKTKKGNATIMHTTIKIKMKTEQKFNIITFYTKPLTLAKEMQEFRIRFNKITQQIGRSKVICGGDTNTTTIYWARQEEVSNQILHSQMETGQGEKHYNNIRKKRARAWANIIQTNKLTCLNNPNEGYTYTHKTNKTKSQIDIIAMGSRALRFWHNFKLKNMNTKHKLLQIESKEQKSTQATNTYQITQINKINQKHFINLKLQAEPLLIGWQMEKREKIIERLNTIVIKTQQALLKAQEKVTKTRIRNTGTKHQTTKIRTLINKINTRLRRKGRNIRYNNVNTSHKKRISIKKLPNIRKYIETRMDKLWKDAKTIRQSNEEEEKEKSKEQNEEIVKDKKELEMIANEKFPESDRNEGKTILRQLTQDWKQDQEHQMNQAAIDHAIYQLRNKTYTGADGIKIQTIIQATQYISWIIENIARMSYYTGYTPECLLKTKGIIIPKKDKGKYRIVHITCGITAIIEQIIRIYLEYNLQKTFNPRQFGFVPRRSRNDIVSRIIQHITIQKSIKEADAKAVIIGLDIDGAFDNVNQNNLINQLYHDITDHRLVLWLTDFILKRSINITYKGMHSKPRKVCKGVPQGSALGPILWNYMIRNIDNNIPKEQFKEAEILAYADDLIIVHTGKNYHKLQDVLNKIQTHLLENNLKISSGKSTCMHIHFRAGTYATRKLYINNQEIPHVKTTNILGTPITHRLTMNTKDKNIITKLLKNAKTLYTINDLGIVRKAKYWKNLIESYIQSITCNNHLSILAIDPRAREWSENLTMSTLKYIFRWAPNTPNKTIRLITGIQRTEDLVNKYTLTSIAEDKESGIRDAYQTIKEIHDNNTLYAQLREHNKIVDILTDTRKPRYASPNSLIEIRPGENIANQMNQVYQNQANISGYWIAIEENKQAKAIRIFGKETTHIYIITHTRTDAPYFNMMALLRTMSLDNQHSDKTIYMYEKSSLYQALGNPTNTDWRVIKLREGLNNNKWTILSLSKTSYDSIRKTINTQYNEQMQKEVWKRNIHIVRKKSSWPTITDYINHLHAKKQIEQRYQNNQRKLIGKVTNTIEEDINIWQTINPSKISATSILALGDLAMDNRKLINGTIEEEKTLECCEQSSNKISLKHLTSHRLLECTKYTNNNMTEIMNKLKAQTNTQSESNLITIKKALKIPKLHRKVVQTIRLASEINNI